MALDQHADIACIGSGAVAEALAHGALTAGRRLVAIGTRSANSTLADALGISACSHQDAAHADVVLLCVPDGAIAEVCSALPWRKGQLVVHTAGALGLDVLSPATDAGAHAGSLHPIMVLHRSSPIAPESDVLRGATASVDGDAEARAWLTAFASDLGMHTVTIEPDQRPLYHLSAALTGGLLTGLLADAAQLWTALGHDAATGAAALGPMVQQAGRMLETRGADGIVMGPAARGDTDTIKRHLEALKTTAPHMLPLYRELVRSCMRHADLTAAQRQALDNTLDNALES